MVEYMGWEFKKMNVSDDLKLSGFAESEEKIVAFAVDLVSFAAGGSRSSVMVAAVSGPKSLDSGDLVAGFVKERFLGAVESAVSSAQDRLNDFISDELEGGER